MFQAAKLFIQNERLFLTESRRSPAAAGLPCHEAGSGSTRGLELSPCSVFSARMWSVPLHEDVGVDEESRAPRHGDFRVPPLTPSASEAQPVAIPAFRLL